VYGRHKADCASEAERRAFEDKQACEVGAALLEAIAEKDILRIGRIIARKVQP
jgi:hypothetical protein